MELVILEQSKNHIKFEIKGEDHTLCNALRSELWNDDNTEAAGYIIEHPLVSSPIMIVDSKSDPKKAISNAISRLKKKNEDFASKVKKL